MAMPNQPNGQRPDDRYHGVITVIDRLIPDTLARFREQRGREGWTSTEVAKKVLQHPDVKAPLARAVKRNPDFGWAKILRGYGVRQVGHAHSAQDNDGWRLYLNIFLEKVGQRYVALDDLYGTEIDSWLTARFAKLAHDATGLDRYRELVNELMTKPAGTQAGEVKDAVTERLRRRG